MKKSFTKMFVDNQMNVQYHSVLNMTQKYHKSQMKKIDDNIKFQNREFRHQLQDIRNVGKQKRLPFKTKMNLSEQQQVQSQVKDGFKVVEKDSDLFELCLIEPPQLHIQEAVNSFPKVPLFIEPVAE